MADIDHDHTKLAQGLAVLRLTQPRVATGDETRHAQDPVAARGDHHEPEAAQVDPAHLGAEHVEVDIGLGQHDRRDPFQGLAVAPVAQPAHAFHRQERPHRMGHDHDRTGLCLGQRLQGLDELVAREQGAVAVIDIMRDPLCGGPGKQHTRPLDPVVFGHLRGVQHRGGEAGIVAVHEQRHLAVLRRQRIEHAVDRGDEGGLVIEVLITGGEKIRRRIRRALRQAQVAGGALGRDRDLVLREMHLLRAQPAKGQRRAFHYVARRGDHDRLGLGHRPAVGHERGLLGASRQRQGDQEQNRRPLHQPCQHARLRFRANPPHTTHQCANCAASHQ